MAHPKVSDEILRDGSVRGWDTLRWFEEYDWEAARVYVEIREHMGGEGK